MNVKNSPVIGFCAVAAILAVLIYTIVTFPTKAQMRNISLVNEVPEQYNQDPKQFLKDFQDGKISVETAVQILALWRIESNGVFLPLDKTDTRLDYYYVDKNRRAWVEATKMRMWQYKDDTYQKK